MELTYRGQDAVVAYVCPSCGVVVSPVAFGEGPPAFEAARTVALEHCNRHCRCGASIRSNRIFCEDCWKTDQRARDEKKFSIAAKVDEKDYGDPVYWESHEGSMGEGYFASLDEVRDYCESSDLKLPSFVWACSPSELQMSVDNILENVFQEHHEGARDMLAEGAEAELETLLADWCKKQNIRSWHADYRRAVMLDQSDTGG